MAFDTYAMCDEVRDKYFIVREKLKIEEAIRLCIDVYTLAVLKISATNIEVALFLPVARPLVRLIIEHLGENESSYRVAVSRPTRTSRI